MERIMKLILAAACLSLTVVPVTAGFAQSMGPMGAISPTQALSNVGLCMTVEGHATLSPAAGRLGMQLTLDDGVNHLTGYIPTPDSFPELSSLDGQTVDVTGVIQMDYGMPEIEMNQPDLVWAAGNTPDALVTCRSSG